MTDFNGPLQAARDAAGRGALVRACILFRRAAALRPTDPVVAVEMGRALIERYRYTEALDQFTRALGLLPRESAEVRDLAAYVCLALKREADAIRHYHAAANGSEPAGP